MRFPSTINLFVVPIITPTSIDKQNVSLYKSIMFKFTTLIVFLNYLKLQTQKYCEESLHDNDKAINQFIKV